MKQKLQRIISTSAVSLLAFAAPAQDTPNPKTDQPDYTRDGIRQARRADRLNGAAKASDLIGMTVKNYQDEKLGKVEDLAVDLESGRVVQVILSTGGFIGIGDTLTAVPPGALDHDVGQKVLQLDANKEKLKTAPKFEMPKWAECCDADHLSEVYSYYGEEPAFTFIQRGDAVRDGRPENPSMISASRLGQVQKASKLMGALVKNLLDEKLGKVENILVDLPSGRVVVVIISSGGFLGMGDELSAVPPSSLRFTTDRDTLQLDASREMLSTAPHFKVNQWPDFAQPSYAAWVYRAYKVKPYFITSVATEPDNTERTTPGRKNSTLTPIDQGNSQEDVKTTALIRKEIIAEKNMSVNGKNVKIITNKGQVTLRGPVNTAEEKRLIGEIAVNIAMVENVDNQLEVK